MPHEGRLNHTSCLTGTSVGAAASRRRASTVVLVQTCLCCRDLLVRLTVSQPSPALAFLRCSSVLRTNSFSRILCARGIPPRVCPRSATVLCTTPGTRRGRADDDCHAAAQHRQGGETGGGRRRCRGPARAAAAGRSSGTSAGHRGELAAYGTKRFTRSDTHLLSRAALGLACRH